MDDGSLDDGSLDDGSLDDGCGLAPPTSRLGCWYTLSTEAITCMHRSVAAVPDDRRAMDAPGARVEVVPE
jgi:hypothetical protein